MSNDATCWETILKEDEIFNKNLMFFLYYKLKFFLMAKISNSRHPRHQTCKIPRHLIKYIAQEVFMKIAGLTIQYPVT